MGVMGPGRTTGGIVVREAGRATNGGLEQKDSGEW